MKTFLNLLYRRILYKIPLKLLLVLLAVFGVLFACFSSAIELPGRADTWSNFYGTNQFGSVVGDSVCFFSKNSSCNSMTIEAGAMTVSGNPYNQLLCALMFGEDIRPIFINNANSVCDIYYFRFNAEDINPKLTSLECQTEYNLIPISSVDQNYCTINNLCPASGPSDCPNVGVSNVFINDLFHPGAFNIIMNIPDEIDWDYAYTNSGQNMNIDVVGYNVDYEKIDSIVAFQNYKPSSEDFQKIIGLLAPYTKIIVFFVFLFIIWAWIKKPFKSKKL